MRGTLSPATDFKGKDHVSDPGVHHVPAFPAHAHPHFYLSGKRSMPGLLQEQGWPSSDLKCPVYGISTTKVKSIIQLVHDDVIKWKHFLRYWPFLRGVNSLHKGQWRRALMFSLIYARINGRVNSGEAGALRRHRAHYDVILMARNECDIGNRYQLLAVEQYFRKWIFVIVIKGP